MKSTRNLQVLIVLTAAYSLTMNWCFSNQSRAEDSKKASAPQKSVVMQTFMKAKLAQSQGILEGLTVEDFGQIERNAAAMYLLTKAEQWKASKDPKFIQHSDEFARLTTKLVQYSKEKNLEGASLVYVQLTLNCVDCHRFVRDSANKARPPKDDKDGEG